MPRFLDVDKRKKDIAQIAFEILGRGGPAGLTLQALADELGGSITMVTHIYPTRAELMRGTVEQILAIEHPPALDPDSGASEEERLRAELQRMTPVSESERSQERGRVAIISEKDQESARIFLDSMERRSRARLRKILEPLLSGAALELGIDYCRATVNGLVLSTVEHPNHWTPARQLAVLEQVVRTIIVMSEGEDES